MTAGKRDMWVGIAVVVVAALGWFVVIPVGIDLPQSIKILALSPAFWPRIVMIILAASGAAIAVLGYLADRRGRPSAAVTGKDDSDAEEGLVRYPLPVQLQRVAGALAALFILYLLVPYAGIVAGSIILILAATWTLGVRPMLRAAPLAIVLPVGLYFFFVHVAQVPIPLGVFEALR